MSRKTMNIISIVTILFLAFGTNIIADDFTDFYPRSFTETDDGENVIVIGSSDNSELALVFDTESFTYYPFEIVELSRPFLETKPLINSKNKLLGYSTESHIIIYNYETGDSVQIFELDYNLYNVEFSYDGKLLYYNDSKKNVLEAYSIETGELIERKNISLVDEGYQLRGINRYYDQIVLAKEDSIAFYSIESDSIVLKNKYVPFYRIEFFDQGRIFSVNTYDSLLISKTQDLSIEHRFENSFGLLNVSLSSNLNYLYILGIENNTHSITDLRTDSIIFMNKYTDESFTPHYLSPNGEVAVGKQITFYYCGRYAEMPSERKKLYIYDWENKKRLRPVPNTYIMHPVNAIFSDDDTKVAVVEGKNDTTLTAIIDFNGEFEKYIYIDGNPKLFLENSSLISYEEEGQLNFYDIDTEGLDKSLDISLSGEVEYHYSSIKRMIVAFNSDSVKVFDYEKWTLDSEYSFDEVGLDSNAKWDGDFGLTSYSEGKISKFDLSSKTLETNTMKEIPEGFIFYDFSPNGRYVLYSTGKYSFGIYDLLLNKYRTQDIEEKYRNRYYTSDVKLLGNLPICYHSLRDEFYTGDEVYFVYDFDYDEYIKYESFSVFRQIAFSNDYSRMLGIMCPTGIFVTQLRDPISSVNTEVVTENTIYPNPTSSHIYLDKLGVNRLTNLRIYNSYGKLVMDIGAAFSSDKLNVDELPTGVYFLKTNEIQASFVKE